jgi:hypothetical protein
MLLRGPKYQIPENLQPQSDRAVGCAISEQQRHLVAILVAEVTRIKAEKPPIDSF